MVIRQSKDGIVRCPVCGDTESLYWTEYVMVERRIEPKLNADGKIMVTGAESINSECSDREMMLCKSCTTQWTAPEGYDFG